MEPSIDFQQRPTARVRLSGRLGSMSGGSGASAIRVRSPMRSSSPRRLHMSSRTNGTPASRWRRWFDEFQGLSQRNLTWEPTGVVEYVIPGDWLGGADAARWRGNPAMTSSPGWRETGRTYPGANTANGASVSSSRRGGGSKSGRRDHGSKRSDRVSRPIAVPIHRSMRVSCNRLAGAGCRTCDGGTR